MIPKVFFAFILTISFCFILFTGKAQTITTVPGVSITEEVKGYYIDSLGVKKDVTLIVPHAQTFSPLQHPYMFAFINFLYSITHISLFPLFLNANLRYTEVNSISLV